MQLPSQLRCPEHQAAFCMTGAIEADKDGTLRASCGCRLPVRRGIPRFVWDETYADAFGLQWNDYRTTQLDSHTGVSISKDRLSRCVGGRLEDLRGASVLEVGCGAGRFTEVLLEAGARVFAVDLSSAVEANYANCGGAPGYFVCQADVLSLPVAPASFDAVIALGMIQHTPSPEGTIEALANSVRPGGLVVVDHYLPLPRVKRLLRAVTPRGILRHADTKILVLPLNHPQGCVGYRIMQNGKVISYCTDVEHGPGWSDKNLKTLAKDADVFIVDSQYTPEELPEHVGWGHSSWKQALETGIESGVKRIALFHHDPYHEDLVVEDILAKARAIYPNVIAAREGLEVTL